jgi:hypothetical protein
MMHECEKSGLAVVAVKPTNKAERSAAEPGEPRAGANGNAVQYSTHRAQYRIGRVPRAEPYTASFAVIHRRWEPYAGKPHVRFCAGGAQQ